MSILSGLVEKTFSSTLKTKFWLKISKMTSWFWTSIRSLSKANPKNLPKESVFWEQMGNIILLLTMKNYLKTS